MVRPAVNAARTAGRRTEGAAVSHGRASGAGNQAAQALLRNHAIQAKPSLSTPDDPLEKEADEVADKVMGSRAGGGMPLNESARTFFEPRFGQDFSAVRIHTDAQAAETAHAINALAYTHGSDIVFAQGRFQPESDAGKRLLAHELAHVVQQGEGAARKPAADTVQRRCGPDEIGLHNDCEAPSSDPDVWPPAEIPPGEILYFSVGCDEFTSVDEWHKARTFADSMLATDTVRVHGFASVDGDATFNQHLSCARAEMAAHALRGGGISPSQIRIIAHGPTPGPEDERRSAILELDAPFTRLPTPQLTGSVLTEPRPGPCADVYYEVMWDISRDSHAVEGGFVVQQVTITRSADADVDCDGNPVAWSHPSPLTYYEAWRVLPGGRRFLESSDTDEFFVARPGTVCGTGSVRWTAMATYFDGVATLPAHMIPDNPATVAGPLRSSLTDPALGGTPSRSVPHELAISWNCCPCDRSSPTVVGAYTPR